MSNDDFELTKLNYQDDDNAATKESINKFLESTSFNVFITIITLWALFGDDIRVIAVTDKDDIYFWVSSRILLSWTKIVNVRESSAIGKIKELVDEEEEVTSFADEA